MKVLLKNFTLYIQKRDGIIYYPNEFMLKDNIADIFIQLTI